MKTLAFVMALAIAPCAANAAENFTFKTTGTAIDSVRVPAEGANFQGVQVTNSRAEVTYASGRRDSVTAKCATWRNPPGAQFPQSGICVSENYDQNFSCQPRPEKTGANCWGLLTGTKGEWKGRTGVVSYTNGPEGLEGSGRWN